MADVETVAALVLTGGASRRMGRDKAMLPIDGVPCAARVAAVARAGVDGPVVEVGRGATTLPLVVEASPGQGPLAAVAAGGVALRDGGHDGPFLVLACDLPFLTAEVLTRLAAEPGTAVPVVDGRLQPLCARFVGSATDVAAAALATGARSMRPLLEALSPRLLDAGWWSAFTTARAFADIDTPEQLAQLGLDG